MHSNYSDITERICWEKPTWWDENGAPRYGQFIPNHCPDIYATVVVLMEIACQNCGRRFHVEMSQGWMNFHRLPPQRWHYGDPPRHDDDTGRGCVGDTMNCDDLTVLEVWRRDVGEWERRNDLEGAMEDATELA